MDLNGERGKEHDGAKLNATPLTCMVVGESFFCTRRLDFKMTTGKDFFFLSFFFSKFKEKKANRDYL